MSGFMCTACYTHCEHPISVMVKISDRAPGPFNAGPACGGIVSTLVECCEEPGCKNEVSAGTPYPGGYKNHCHLHPPITTNNQDEEGKT